MRKLLQEWTGFVALAVGLASGVAQLYGWPTGVGRIILAGLGFVCLIYLIIRYSLLRYVRVVEQLSKERAVQQVAHQNYVDAIDRIIDQEGPIYRESLVLVVTVGTDDDGDTIRESRRTTPKPRVTQRAIRPIVPDGHDRIVGLDDLKLDWSLDRPNGKITTLPLKLTGKPRVWLVFDPGQTETFAWEIGYCSHGLWGPLRKHGYDHLIWNDRLPAGNGGNSVLTDLTVRFVFPESKQAPSVSERHGFGEVEPATQREGGGWVIVWTDPAPAGRRYEWDLAQALPGKA